MGKKKNKNNVNGGETKNNEENHQPQQNVEGNKEEEEEVSDAKKSTKSVNVVLKVDLHCDGCASKVVKCIRAFEGVESVKCEGGSNKLTVIGDVDPVKLREKVEQKTHKKVELISPVPKKENKENKNNNNNDGDKKGSKDNNNNPNDEKKKSKELPITTAVMKVHLHCEGCIQKIHKAVTKTAGYREMKIDRQKELVTVTGAMDMKALAEYLKKHLKKNVEIVPPKKEGEKKEKGDGGGNGGNGGGGDKKKGDRDEKAGDGNGEKLEGNKMQVQLGYPNPFMYGPGAGPGYVGGVDQFQFQYQPYDVHAPQMFSDENPNACIIM